METGNEARDIYSLSTDSLWNEAGPMSLIKQLGYFPKPPNHQAESIVSSQALRGGMRLIRVQLGVGAMQVEVYWVAGKGVVLH